MYLLNPRGNHGDVEKALPMYEVRCVDSKGIAHLQWRSHSVQDAMRYYGSLNVQRLQWLGVGGNVVLVGSLDHRYDAARVYEGRGCWSVRFGTEHAQDLYAQMLPAARASTLLETVVLEVLKLDEAALSDAVRGLPGGATDVLRQVLPVSRSNPSGVWLRHDPPTNVERFCSKVQWCLAQGHVLEQAPIRRRACAG